MTSLGAPATHDCMPFDAIADTYDQVFTDSLVGKTQRAQVWGEMDNLFGPGQRILEINCGTGADALHLAQRGVKVVACDASARMVAVARQRLSQAGLLDFVAFRDLPIERIDLIQDQGPFDGLVSNFAGLNCVTDLNTVAIQLAALLRPGAKALLCLFGRWCLWEMLWYAAQADLGKAFRRERRNLVTTTVGPVRYHTVEEVKRQWAPHFRLIGWQGVGVVVPPSYLEPWAQRCPRLFQTLATTDSWLRRVRLARAFGDHILLTFERCPS